MTRTKIRLLAWFTFFPIVVTLITELNKSIVLWHFRIVDLVDLVVLAPFYFIILYALHRTTNPSEPLAKYSIGSMVVFLYGHAMHITANSINTFITEVNAYREIIPDDVYELIYFLDEDLSHLLMFVSLWLLFMLWCYMESHGKEVISCWPIATLGLVEGIAWAIAMIEATKPYLPFILAFATLIGLAKINNNALWPRSTFLCYMLLVTLGLFVTPIIYWLVFGSLLQPSAL